MNLSRAEGWRTQNVACRHVLQLDHARCRMLVEELNGEIERLELKNNNKHPGHVANTQWRHEKWRRGPMAEIKYSFFSSEGNSMSSVAWAFDHLFCICGPYFIYLLRQITFLITSRYLIYSPALNIGCRGVLGAPFAVCGCIGNGTRHVYVSS